MSSERTPDAVIFGYLSAVFTLSIGTIALLYLSFVSGLPAFLRTFVNSPVRALSGNPLRVGFVVVILLTVLALIAVIVVSGAKVADRVEEPPK